MSKLLIIAVLSLALAGQAAAPKQQHVNLILRPECLTKPVELIDCDMNTEPPHCKSSKISYKPSCAEIVITKAFAAPEQHICRADMDGRVDGFLWDYWDDWYWDECS